MPMLVTRQERNLAIDGVYIHVRSLFNILWDVCADYRDEC